VTSSKRGLRDALGNTETYQGSLPFWPDHTRGVPWVALRSALFAPVRSGTRRSMQREKLASISTYEIRFTGIQLDQADLDVYEQVLHLAKAIPLGRAVEFKTRQMLSELGRSQGGKDREWLLKSLARMQACAIEFRLSEGGPAVYIGSLILRQGRVENEKEAATGSGMHYLILDEKLASLYDSGFSTQNWANRLKLGKNQLAKWLFGFASDLSRPLTFKVDALMQMSNSNYKRVRDFKAALEDAAAANRAAGVNLFLVFDRKGMVRMERRESMGPQPLQQVPRSR